jgi:hypothetical protein
MTALAVVTEYVDILGCSSLTACCVLARNAGTFSGWTAPVAVSCAVVVSSVFTESDGELN